MGEDSTFLSRLIDLRREEGRPFALAFTALLLLIAGHTVLETARDALFLTKLPPSQLAIAYAALAVVTLFTARWTGAIGRRFGQRNALVVTLLVAALVVTALRSESPPVATVYALYLVSGVLGTLLATQFWTLTGQLFTVAQGRRLFGPIAAGGVVGAVTGASFAAAAVSMWKTSALLTLSAWLFVATALVVTALPRGEEQTPAARGASALSAVGEVGKSSLALRVTLLAVVSTITVLVADYLFKSVVSASMPKEELARFFARYYAVLNAASLGVQLLVAGRLIRRLGVTGSAVVLPVMMTLGAGGVLATGGLLGAVLVLKGVDGGLRYSVHRIAMELLYLPLPATLRARVKALVDAVLTRIVQAIAAGGVFALAAAGLASPTVLAGVLLGLGVLWIGVAVSMRGPYMSAFRQAIAVGGIDDAEGPEEIDVASAEALIEALASPDANVVVSSMRVLDHRGRGRLIPALILYHHDPEVLVRALGILSRDERRKDWFSLAERLLESDDDGVRAAAARALASRGVVRALEQARTDTSPAVRAYAAYHAATAADAPPEADAAVRLILDDTGPSGAVVRRALLDAIASAPGPRWGPVLFELLDHAAADPSDAAIDAVDIAGRAIEALHDERFVPDLVERLAHRSGRDHLRAALVALGDPALDALAKTLEDPWQPRRLRLHVPRTIGMFRSQRAADVLVRALGKEKDGLVRYRVLRGLGRLVAGSEVRVDLGLLARELERNLVEHIRLAALAATLGAGAPVDAATHPLLAGLLEDKGKQALERAFRILQISFKHEDMRRAYVALTSGDKRARANVSEFVDVLLVRGDRKIRELVRIVTDDLDPVARARAAADWVEAPPRTYRQAVDVLKRDADATVAMIAEFHAGELGPAGRTEPPPPLPAPAEVTP